MRIAASVIVVLSLAGLADADPSVADQTFQRGRELMKQKKFAEACAAFEQSQRLDPQLGTLFNLADCEVELGKLATAWNRYRELARTDPDTARRALSADLAAKLAHRVPKLLVEITQRPPGLAVTIDGIDSTSLVGVETPVDLGDHAVVAQAPGFHAHTETITVKDEGKVAKLTIVLEPGEAQQQPPPLAPPIVRPPAEPPTDNPRRHYGKLAVIGGGAIVAGGLVFGGLAWNDWHHAQCTAPITSDCTYADQDSFAHRARIFGDVSTAVVIVGLVPAAIGTYLLMTSSSVAIVPQAGSDHAGVAILGRF